MEKTCVPFFVGRLKAMHCPTAEKPDPGYDLEESRLNLIENFQSIIDALKDKPTNTMPQSYLTFEMVMHPERTSEINYPRALIKYLKLACLIHYRRPITPRSYFGNEAELPGNGTIVLLLSCQKKYLTEIPEKLKKLWPGCRAKFEMANVEKAQVLEPHNRLDPATTALATPTEQQDELFGAILLSFPNGQNAIGELCNYAAPIGFSIVECLPYNKRGDVVVCLKGPRARLVDLAEFQFIHSIGHPSVASLIKSLKSNTDKSKSPFVIRRRVRK